MIINKNHEIIKKNKTISQVVLYSSLAILLIGLLWSFSSPDITQTVTAYLILIPAYILVQISIYMANKWGRSPRPDEIIDQSLKGLSDQFALYHYVTPVPHLLIGPAGIWIIKPYHHSGEIVYNSDKNRFEQTGGPNIISKLFAQESLPNIDKDSKKLLEKLSDYLMAKEITEMDNIRVVNIFFSDKADVRAKNAPETTLHSNKFKEFIRSQAKLVNFGIDKINLLKSKL